MQATNDEPITSPGPTPRNSVKRIAADMRSCTLHVPIVDYQHLARLALERSGPRTALGYGDLVRTAIREYVERNPLGSPGASAPALLPTPIEQLGARGMAASTAMRELEAAGFFVHARVRAGRDSTLCGLVGVGDAALAEGDDPQAITCRNCRSILESNAKALEREATTSSSKRRAAPAKSKRATKKRGSR